MSASNESQSDQSVVSEADSIALNGKADVRGTSGINGEEQADSGKSVRFVLNVPNILTMIRLLAVVPLAILISQWPAKRFVTVILFVVIWVTDFLDGFIARRFNMMTEFGKLFDPFVDKVFQVVTIVMLFYIGLVPLWVPLFYVLRETAMLFASSMLLAKHHVVVYSDCLGKISTFLFVVAVSIVYFIQTDKAWLREVIFIVPVLSSLVATIHYGITYVRSIRKADSSD